ncbi:MAG: hypothetical protein WCK82_01190 [Bacteroidota bacterium]
MQNILDELSKRNIEWSPKQKNKNIFEEEFDYGIKMNSFSSVKEYRAYLINMHFKCRIRIENELAAMSHEMIDQIQLLESYLLTIKEYRLTYLPNNDDFIYFSFEIKSSISKTRKVCDGSLLDVPLIQFGWDKELNRHIYLGVKSKEESEERKLNELQEVARNAFSLKPTLSMNELTQTLMDALQVKNRMARNYIKFMKDHQIIEKLPENSNEFRMVL